jgi:ACS family glucarate transporter-like MFS transporter
MVRLTGNWGSALVVIALAAAVGTVLWLFVHPEKPLFDTPQAPVAAPLEEHVQPVASNNDLTSDLTSEEVRP